MGVIVRSPKGASTLGFWSSDSRRDLAAYLVSRVVGEPGVGVPDMFGREIWSVEKLLGFRGGV